MNNSNIKSVISNSALAIFGITTDTKNLIDSVLVKLREMQHRLNINLCGKDYVADGKTIKGKTISFPKALMSETIELMDSTPWKHWKNINAPIDYDNVITELIDELHFTLSHAIMMDYYPPAKDDVKSNLFEGYFSVLAVERYYNTYSVYHEFVNKLKANTITDEDISNYITTVIDTNIAMMLTYSGYAMHNNFSIYSENMYVNYNIIFSAMLIKAFKSKTELDELSSMTYINEIVESYILKNALNTVRANRGYKEGTYIKNWTISGETYEDNYVVKQIIEFNESVSSSDNYEAELDSVVDIITSFYDGHIAGKDGDFDMEYIAERLKLSK